MTVGGNQVLCYPSSANCVAGAAGTIRSGFTVESGYAAGTGYDLATGLGSVDVANLIKYWSSITPRATKTTLSISPATVVHGKAATITSSVAPASGSGTPTGSIALTGNDALPGGTGIGDFPLTAGAVYAPINNLPGGTYLVTAAYSGDATYAASESAPVTVTVTPENATLAASGGAWNPYDLNLYPLSAGITLPYGAQVFLDAQPLGSNATLVNQPAQATGTVTFTDKVGTATTASTQPLNTAGMAEWSTGVFAPGSHIVSEVYSGDASYNAVTLASAASFTIVPGSTSLSVVPLVTTVAGGGSVTVNLQLNTGYLPLYGKLPTGAVTVTLGGKQATATLQAIGTTGNQSLAGAVTFTSVAAGMLPLTATYAGDGNWLGSSANGGVVIALSQKLTPAVTLASSSASPTPAQTFTLTATVTGQKGKATPTGTVIFQNSDQSSSYAATLSNGKAAVTIPANALANGTSVFTASYLGDTNYTAGASNAVNVTVNKSDFSLTSRTPQVAIAPGKTGIGTLVLAPVNGFSGTVALTVSAPTGISATLGSASLAVSSSTTDQVNLSVGGTVGPGNYPVVITATGGGKVHTAQIVVAVLATAAPVFSPAGGSYTAVQQVALSDSTPGSAIYYTTNGADPTTSSTRYSRAIPVSATTTLKAIAVASNALPSPIVAATYALKLTAAAPVFSPAAGTYTTGQSVTITDATPNATIYYTTNGATPTTSSTKYTGAISVAASATVKAVAIATGYSLSAAASAAYTIQKVTANPTFSPAAGTYNGAQSVTITSATSGAAIYYTTNGATPTTSSTKYTGAISVAASAAVKAVAIATGYSLSAVASAAYTIQKVTASPTFSPAAGTYNGAQSVTITSATSGAAIYYTTNGSTPTTNSTRYTGAIKVSATQTISTIAVASGYVASPVIAAKYTISTVATHLKPDPEPSPTNQP